MSSGERTYASVPERITWTTGFQLAVDKHVLGVLSVFADFKTGRGARPSLEKLVARCELARSTVLRALRRLETDGWITVHRRHRRPTVYDINVERLKAHWIEAKGGTGLSVTGDTQGTRILESLSVTDDTQDPVLSVTGDTQEAVLSVTGDTPSPVRTIPCTYEPLYKHRRFARRDLPDGLTADDAGGESLEVPRDATDRDADLSTDRGDHARGDPASSDGGLQQSTRSDQTPARDAGLQLPAGSDHAGPGGGAARDDPPRQLTFGPHDLSPPPVRTPQWGQLADAIKTALQRRQTG